MERRLAILGAVVFVIAALALAKALTSGGASTSASASALPASPGTAPQQAPEYLQGTPQGLLSNYLEGDFQGERLERATWPTKYKPMVTWETEPAWDTAYIVNRYQLQPGNTTLKEAHANVTFETMGELSLVSYEYRPSPTRQTVPYTLEMTQTGWRIGYPMLKPHVSPEAAIAYLQRMEVGYPQLRSRIQRSIDTLNAQVRGGAPQLAPTP